MAAKFLHSLTDENPELQKQIGCMTGIFQMFDRQHMLTGGRRAVGHSPRRIPPGSSCHNTGASEGEMNGTNLKSASQEKYAHKNVQERQRVSTESSRASFSSSSRSSSFSSPECNRAAQSEQLSFDKMIFSEIHSGDTATSLQHPSPQFGRQATDLRDFVKDSMYREMQSLSVKAKGIEEAPASVAKHQEPQRIDSNISSVSRGSGLDQRERTPTDLKESLRVLAKLQESSRYCNEPRELVRSSSCHFKDGSSFPVSRDAPRFSYDGRDINRAPLDSRDASKSSIKLKELPRLSLDSREVSTRSLNADSNMVKDNGVFDGKFPSPKHVLGNQARPTSVVAKLMGLEMLPDAVPSGGVDKGSERCVNMPTSLEKTEQIRPIPLSTSSKSSWKEPSSPRWRSPDGSMKPMSRLPIEPAPWKMDGSKSIQKPAPRTTRGLAKAPMTFPSVYSEIEKRLKDLEFHQSGKDLRALKQILEAMQTKGLLETPKEGQDSSFNGRGDDEEIVLGSTRSVDNKRPQAGHIPAHARQKATSAQNQESPIVIMKPVKLVEKSGMPAGSVISQTSISGVTKHQGNSVAKASKDQIVKSVEPVNGMNSLNKTSDKSVKTTTRSQQAGKEANAGKGKGKSSGSISPRMQQKKVELEKRSRPPTSPDSTRPTRQLYKQQGESSSPGGRRRTKGHSHQKTDDQMSESSVENEVSPQLNLSTVRGSKNSQATNSERTPNLRSIRSPSAKAADFTLSDLKSATVVNEEDLGESGSVQVEYSSPVSVLENVLCKQDSPSPVKYAGKALKVETARVIERNVIVDEQGSVDGFAPISGKSSAAFEINRRKLQSIESLVQKLQRLNSTHDEARTDYIASLCENTDPDHRYVSEVLLASGLLLRDLSSSLTDFQFHPSGNPINPDLFLVLEQKKASSSSKEELSTERKAQSTLDKIHRKLIFDVTNEMLAQRLAPTVPHSEPWIKLVRRARKTSNAQKLLRELCAEIDGLKAKNPKCRDDDEDGDDDDWKNILSYDVMHRSGCWSDFNGEISGAVLDIERLIFKDLVNEVVNGESAGLIAKGRRKKASSKK